MRTVDNYLRGNIGAAGDRSILATMTRSLSSTKPTRFPGDSFGDALREWRRSRGWSQLELALRAEVSTRHVSFLENGRSRASRDMVLQLGHAMGLSLREQNQLLTAAGFACLYSERSPTEPEMAMVRRAVRRTLESHEPYPAFATDRLGDSWDANAANEYLLPLFTDDPETLELAGTPPNVLRMVFPSQHPQTPHPQLEPGGERAGTSTASRSARPQAR